MHRFIIGSLFFICLAYSACTQVPANRPDIANPKFDRKLSQLLDFSVPVIGVTKLKENQAKYLLLDIREREEYEVSHIQGAQYLGYKNIDYSKLDNISKDQPLVLYCSVGYRSEKIGEKLKKKGFQKVYNLYGSIFEWVNQGYPVVDRDNQPTTKVHTYNKKWGQWVDPEKADKIW